MTIRSKIAITNVLVFGLILIGVGAVVYDRMQDAEMVRIDYSLEMYVATLVTAFDDALENGSRVESDDIVALAVPPLSDLRILLLDDSGKIICRHGELPSSGNPADRLHGGSTAIKETISLDGERYRLSARLVEIDDGADYLLLVATSTEEIDDRLARLMLVLLVTSTVALFLSALAVYYITGRAFRPITRMVEAAEEISASTLHHRLRIPPEEDEVRRLAVALNEMMQRIENAFRSQRQFVADASHELRTPLTVVYSELEFLKRRIEDDHLTESIDTVLGEIDRLSNLVQQLLLLARIDARKLSIGRETVRLDEVLVDCVRLMQTLASERSVRLDVRIEEAVELEGDTGHLKRALLNVIENALKYSPSGEVVLIELTRLAEVAVVRITDRGPGIDSADREHVFERFYRSPGARLEQDGSGLGLAIAKELIEAHGGRITLSTPEVAGTIVTVSLPLGGFGGRNELS